MCKTKFAISIQKLQRDPPNSYQKRIKNVLTKRCYFGKIKDSMHYGAVDTKIFITLQIIVKLI